MKIAFIEWNDAYHSNGDVAPEQIADNFMKLYSAGIVVEHNKEAIKIALDYSPGDGDYRETAVIPMKYVVNLVVLDFDAAKPKPRKKKKV